MGTPYELNAYANSRWVAPPAEMLMPLFFQALQRTNYFYAVVSPPFAGVTQLRLDTQLLKLQQEFLLPTSQVRLIIQVALVNNVTNQIVGSKQFVVVIPAIENNAYGGVLATNKAAVIVSARIAEFVVQQAKERAGQIRSHVNHDQVSHK